MPNLGKIPPATIGMSLSVSSWTRNCVAHHAIHFVGPAVTSAASGREAASCTYAVDMASRAMS